MADYGWRTEADLWVDEAARYAIEATDVAIDPIHILSCFFYSDCNQSNEGFPQQKGETKIWKEEDV